MQNSPEHRHEEKICTLLIFFVIVKIFKYELQLKLHISKKSYPVDSFLYSIVTLFLNL